MKGVIGFALFIALSVAVHASVLLTMPQGGVQGQGGAGEDTLTLSAASEALANLVEQWDNPPDPAPQPRLFQPTLRDPITPQILPDTPVQTLPPPHLSPPHLSGASPEVPPHIITAAAPPVPTPGVAISTAPNLQTPPRPTGFAPPAINPDTPRPANTAPRLAAPSDIDLPRRNTRPHFEGSTALAADASPRPQRRPAQPQRRPEGLTPTPQPPNTTPQPQLAAPPPQAPAPDRTAAGTGGGITQGAAPAPQPTPQPTPQPAISTAQIQGAMAQWGGQIQARIARSRPNVTGSGRATVQLSVGRNGQLQGLGLAQSSGNPAVDQAALDAVRRAGRFPRAPAALTDASYSFSVPLTFQ